MKHRLIIEFYSQRLATYDMQLGCALVLPQLIEELKDKDITRVVRERVEHDQAREARMEGCVADDTARIAFYWGPKFEP
ncbi:MAG TPA: hypothetical protein VEU47_11010 [Candidatus Cybelea sp.]|nr:hypothetical protein [Candidatus Cybelea sp.]